MLRHIRVSSIVKSCRCDRLTVNIYTARCMALQRTSSLPILKLRQMRSWSLTLTCLIGIHSWYARTPASLRSEKHIPDGENEHPTVESLLSAVPAFQVWSAIYIASISVDTGGKKD